VWGGGVIGYLLVQHALVQWHHWAFRFMVLAAPWIAVVSAWGVGCLPGKLRVAAWTVLVVSALDVFAVVQWRTSQAAWQALNHPERSASYFVYSHWRAWAGQLDQPAEPLRLAFPIDHALASFYRLAPARQVEQTRLSEIQPGTAEAVLGSLSGWLVVPLEQFMGREGRVMGRTTMFGLAAYRTLRAGERPQPLLYTYRLRKMGEMLRDELLLRTWVDAPVRLELFNSGTKACRFELHTPTTGITDVVPAGARLVLGVPVPADILSWVTIDVASPAPEAVAQSPLRIRLVP